MPKQKSNKSVRRRVKVTGKGRLKRARAGRRHLLSGKSAKRRRRLRKPSLVSSAEERALKRLLVYGV